MTPSQHPAAAPLVLFDLDGTVLDPGGAITEGIAEAIEAHGYPRPDPETLRKFVGPTTSYSLERFTSIPEGDRRSILAMYRSAYPERALKDSRVYEGLRDLLVRIRAAGALTAIATQKPQPSADRMIKAFGLADVFDVVSGARDELNPDTAHLPADKTGIIARAVDLVSDPALRSGPDRSDHGDSSVRDLPASVPDLGRSVMIGDRVYDVDGALANGLPCVGVGWGFAEDGELGRAGARWVVDTPAELADVLAEYCGLDLESVPHE